MGGREAGPRALHWAEGQWGQGPQALHLLQLESSCDLREVG
jgi:hypothetical protein